MFASYVRSEARRKRPGGDVPRRKAYPLREAAQLLGISLTKLKDEVRDRKLAVVHAGRRRRLLDGELTRYLLTNGHSRRS